MFDGEDDAGQTLAELVDEPHRQGGLEQPLADHPPW